MGSSHCSYENVKVAQEELTSMSALPWPVLLARPFMKLNEQKGCSPHSLPSRETLLPDYRSGQPSVKLKRKSPRRSVKSGLNRCRWGLRAGAEEWALACQNPRPVHHWPWPPYLLESSGWRVRENHNPLQRDWHSSLFIREKTCQETINHPSTTGYRHWVPVACWPPSASCSRLFSYMTQFVYVFKCNWNWGKQSHQQTQSCFTNSFL